MKPCISTLLTTSGVRNQETTDSQFCITSPRAENGKCTSDKKLADLNINSLLVPLAMGMGKVTAWGLTSRQERVPTRMSIRWWGEGPTSRGGGWTLTNKSHHPGLRTVDLRLKTLVIRISDQVRYWKHVLQKFVTRAITLERETQMSSEVGGGRLRPSKADRPCPRAAGQPWPWQRGTQMAPGTPWIWMISSSFWHPPAYGLLPPSSL